MALEKGAFMVKHSLRFLLSATLLVASGSFARADNFTVTSDWSWGSTANLNLHTFTGNGSFTEVGGVFSNIVFNFVQTSPTPVTTDWTATEGLLVNGGLRLELGNGTSDCNGVNCVTLNLSAVLGSIPVVTGLNTSSEQGGEPPVGGAQPAFIDATVTDTSIGSVGTVPEPTSIALLLTVLAGTGFALRKKLHGVSAITES
jgi:hypothetical protein